MKVRQIHTIVAVFSLMKWHLEILKHYVTMYNVYITLLLKYERVQSTSHGAFYSQFKQLK